MWALQQHQEFQACSELLRTVRAVQIKEQQQGSVQTELDSFFKLAFLCSKKRAQLLSLLSVNKYMFFICFQIKAIK
jgi:hypothetical protein